MSELVPAANGPCFGLLATSRMLGELRISSTPGMSAEVPPMVSASPFSRQTVDTMSSTQSSVVGLAMAGATAARLRTRAALPMNPKDLSRRSPCGVVASMVNPFVESKMKKGYRPPSIPDRCDLGH
jgi:hypothetical protein